MNPIDQFRYTVLEKIIEEEKQKQADYEARQRACYHRFSMEVPSYLNGYRRFECDKCGYTTLRRANTLKGTNGLDACGIS